MKNFFATLLFVSLVSLAFATPAKKQIVFALIPPNGYAAQTTVYFDLGIAPAFVASQDAPEALGTNPGEPSLYSFSSDNVMCSLNGYSTLTTSAVIALGIKTDTAGTYLFIASLLSNFDSTSIILLEDRQLNIFTDFRRNSYAVQLTDTGFTNGRFFLHVSSAILLASVTAGCDNNNGLANIVSDNAVLWTSSTLYDTTGTLINSYNNVSGTYSFTGLGEGNYNLVLYFNGYYVATRQLQVNGNHIIANILPLQLTASIQEPVTFQTLTVNATQYVWGFGDGSQITGIANPTFEYYEAGVFKVLLVCSNDSGCMQSDSVTMTVTSATGINNVATETRNVWAYSKTITVALTEDITEGAALQIYDLLGQPVYNAAISTPTTTIELNNKPNGYYIVSLQNNNVTTSKKVLLMN